MTFLAATTEDPRLLALKDRIGSKSAAQANGESHSSTQHERSAKHEKLTFGGLRTTAGGHRIQDVKELMELPVIIMSDLTKSPPVLVVYACELGQPIASCRN